MKIVENVPFSSDDFCHGSFLPAPTLLVGASSFAFMTYTCIGTRYISMKHPYHPYSQLSQGHINA